jgi:hypothetical protein
MWDACPRNQHSSVYSVVKHRKRTANAQDTDKHTDSPKICPQTATESIQPDPRARE